MQLPLVPSGLRIAKFVMPKKLSVIVPEVGAMVMVPFKYNGALTPELVNP
jgi:hypothetical protein